MAVTSLSFHPFAFASPLAIDYDGYVNTTQNNIDSALIEHLYTPADTIEARQEGGPGPYFGVAAVITIIFAVALGLDWMDHDQPVRCK